MNDLSNSMLAGKKTIDFPLTDWQKVDAFNTFVHTKQSYFMNAAVLERGWAKKIDAQMRRLVIKAMRFPRGTVTVFLHTAIANGGLGLTSLEDNMDSTNIIKSPLCLSSPDKLIQDVAWSQVSDVVRRRCNKNDLSSVDIESFLNSPPDVGESRQSDVRSLWTVVRKSFKLLLCSIQIQDSEIFLVCDDSIVSVSQRKLISDMLNDAKNERRIQKLLEVKEQERTFHSTSECTDSN